MQIYNAKIYTMSEAGIIENGFIRVENGKIAEVSKGKPKKISDTDIDAKGKMLFPGFIDAHTHMGLFESGVGAEGDDCNEDSDPVTPNLRAIDAVNCLDESFLQALMMGITTVVTGCGSSNPIGGDFIAMKTLGRYADDSLIRTVGIKFALGENPKGTFSDKDSAPVTRMATAAIMREALYKAKRYMEDLEKAEDDEDVDKPEYDAKCEALMPLLKREIKAFFHCHKANDIMTAVRVAEEFNLDYMLVHCTEGWQISSVLGEKGVCASIGPIISDKGKPELKNLRIDNAAMLCEDGVTLSICTDHPEVPIQYLAMSAAIVEKNGMPHEKALEAITINAAKMCGIEDRVGSVEVGKDADITLFSENPLGVEVKPNMVIIGGRIIVQNERRVRGL